MKIVVYEKEVEVNASKGSRNKSNTYVRAKHLTTRSAEK